MTFSIDQQKNWKLELKDYYLPSKLNSFTNTKILNEDT